ncbi:hypothetical protein BDZ91DRAFT_765128 [Kalaharituber pfeilii]|nr:hypothetical protein BDZ91DRAFT_765128 [Kalaharituber pfeilii]
MGLPCMFAPAYELSMQRIKGKVAALRSYNLAGTTSPQPNLQTDHALAGKDEPGSCRHKHSRALCGPLPGSTSTTWARPHARPHCAMSSTHEKDRASVFSPAPHKLACTGQGLSGRNAASRARHLLVLQQGCLISLVLQFPRYLADVQLSFEANMRADKSSGTLISPSGSIQPSRDQHGFLSPVGTTNPSFRTLKLPWRWLQLHDIGTKDTGVFCTAAAAPAGRFGNLAARWTRLLQLAGLARLQFLQAAQDNWQETMQQD